MALPQCPAGSRHHEVDGGGLGLPPGPGGVSFTCQVSVGLAVGAGHSGKPGGLQEQPSQGTAAVCKLESLLGPGKAALAGAGQGSAGSRGAWPQGLLGKGEAPSSPTEQRRWS